MQALVGLDFQKKFFFERNLAIPMSADLFLITVGLWSLLSWGIHTAAPTWRGRKIHLPGPLEVLEDLMGLIAASKFAKNKDKAPSVETPDSIPPKPFSDVVPDQVAFSGVNLDNPWQILMSSEFSQQVIGQAKVRAQQLQTKEPEVPGEFLFWIRIEADQCESESLKVQGQSREKLIKTASYLRQLQTMMRCAGVVEICPPGLSYYRSS